MSSFLTKKLDILYSLHLNFMRDTDNGTGGERFITETFEFQRVVKVGNR